MEHIKYSDFIILCKEINPKNGEIFVKELKVETTPDLVRILNLRSRFNPDLEYFLTHKNNLTLTKRALEGNLLSNKVPENTFQKI